MKKEIKPLAWLFLWGYSVNVIKNGDENNFGHHFLFCYPDLCKIFRCFKHPIAKKLLFRFFWA